MSIVCKQTTVSQPRLDIETETNLSQTVPDLIDISWIGEVLQAAAERARAYYLYEYGENYKVEDLKQCFVLWLDSCIELFCDEAFEMCVEDKLNPINRHAFEQAFVRIKPAEPEEPDISEIPS